MPCYAMSCFKLLVTLCKEIEAAIARFWWKPHKEKHGIHWVSWAKLSHIKKAGCLGFRDIQCFNITLRRLVGGSFITRAPCLLACYMISTLSWQLSSLPPPKNHPLGDVKAFSKGNDYLSLVCVGVSVMALKSRCAMIHGFLPRTHFELSRDILTYPC